MSAISAQGDKITKFVDYLFTRCQRDKGFAARLRRADNPSTEYQSWEVLVKFNIDLDFASKRLPYALVAASIAKSDASANGSLPLGRSIARAFEGGADDPPPPAKMRLRRLLACDKPEEACRILRPLLTLIQSRVSETLDYKKLLNDLLKFSHNPQRVKACWAKQFYYRSQTDANDDKSND